MRLRDLFISEDKRRGRVRPTILSWIVVAVMLALSVGGIAVGIRHIGASAPVVSMKPVATSSLEAEAEGMTATKAPTASPEVACPQDPSAWSMVPYDMPGSDRVVYKIQPPCVMEQVEETFRAYLETKLAAGREWSSEEQALFYTPAGFTKPLTEEKMAALPELRPACTETAGRDGKPPSFTQDVVFYTAGQDGLVVDVLYASKPHGAYTFQHYDCETGELTAREARDGTEGFIAYWPMLYEQGRWRLAYQADVYHEVPADELDPHALADTVRAAQGRD